MTGPYDRLYLAILTQGLRDVGARDGHDSTSWFSSDQYAAICASLKLDRHHIRRVAADPVARASLLAQLNNNNRSLGMLRTAEKENAA